MRGFCLVLLLILPLLGCQDVTRDVQSRTVQEEVGVKKDLSGLTCFQCHSFEKFNSAFPHDGHRAMGLHCTQCHIIRGHREAKLVVETCNNCHNLTRMQLSLTSMPASFDHRLHSGMFGCRECHPDLFPMKLNSKRITMVEIQMGKACGKCHNGGMAFASSECQRCHEM